MSRRAVGEAGWSDSDNGAGQNRIDTLESALLRSLERGKRLIDSFSAKQQPSAEPVRNRPSKVAKSASAGE
jgi:hypothetical protein